MSELWKKASGLLILGWHDFVICEIRGFLLNQEIPTSQNLQINSPPPIAN
jgi:hypothetical protein